MPVGALVWCNQFSPNQPQTGQKGCPTDDFQNFTSIFFSKFRTDSDIFVWLIICNTQASIGALFSPLLSILMEWCKVTWRNTIYIGAIKFLVRRAFKWYMVCLYPLTLGVVLKQIIWKYYLFFAFIGAHGTAEKGKLATKISVAKNTPVPPDPKADSIAILPSTPEGRNAVVAIKNWCGF